MGEAVLLEERREGVVVLTLNRPEARNALSRALRVELARTFERLGGDEDVRVVILTGRGRAFCAGLDLKELGGETRPAEGPRGMLGETDMIGAIRAFDRPLIGAVNGPAVTGGFELALACDLLVASSEARFADTHARVGILPGWGLSQLLPRIVGPGRAKELSFTGNYLDAETALAWGLVNRVVPPSELLPTCEALARDMLSCDRRALLGIKRSYDEGFATTLAEGLRLEARAAAAHAKAVKPGDIASRRAAIQARGREQTGG
jgi:enoyl-CoA hydratase